MTNNIILVGNPNVGKTTLFNTLTNSNEKASNWHGVTVSEKIKSYKFRDEVFEVTDLPGMYSLNGYSNEEKVACKFLEKHKDDLVVNICDANNLKRNLNLSKALIDAGYRVILAINMSNEVEVDSKKISKSLGVKVINIDARKKASVDKLKDLIFDLKNEKIITGLTKVNRSDFKEISASVQKLEPYKITDKIDKIVLNKFVFIPLFLSVLFLVFYITFGFVGECFSAIFNLFFSQIFGFLQKLILCLNISPVIKSFFIDGIIGSVSSICSFLPQILLLMILINLLEDIGFMSRLAFMFDGVLKKVGLTGKSLFSLMMGYGCTTSAIMTTRNLENSSLKKRTALLLPFSTCSAKLPVFLVISSLFFDKYKYLLVLVLYLFSVLISLGCAIIYKKFIPDKNNVFVMEMPKYRLPYFKKIFRDSLSTIKEFLIKVGTLIMFFSSFLWILQNFSTDFTYLGGENFNQSILYFLSSKLALLFKPIGLGSSGVVASLVLGIVAKELVVVGLAMINGVSGLAGSLEMSLTSADSICFFTPITSIVFLIFILLYSPCISALGAIKNEFGFKTALFVFVFQFALSYFVCLIVYNLLIGSWIVYLILLVFLLDIFGVLMLKLYRKKNCGGNCNACRKIKGSKTKQSIKMFNR